MEASQVHSAATLTGHTSAVWSVDLSSDGRLLASTSFEGTIRLWEVVSGFDGTLRLWDLQTGTFLRLLRADRRYERMDITGLSGITGAQREALLTLGAVDRL